MNVNECTYAPNTSGKDRNVDEGPNKRCVPFISGACMH